MISDWSSSLGIIKKAYQTTEYFPAAGASLRMTFSVVSSSTRLSSCFAALTDFSDGPSMSK